MTSEQDLLSKAKEFDTCALAEIYDLYSPRLYRYAMRLLGDNFVAEDCVAETFSRFIQALQSRNGPRDYLQAYLFRTAHNLVVDHYRRQPPLETLDEQSACDDNVEESADRCMRQRRTRAAMRELSAAQQQVIALKFIEGWENDDIARALNKPIGAVKSLQHRALAHLQKILLEKE